MIYRSRDYGHLLGIDGFSDELLDAHMALYRDHVAETNRIVDALSAPASPTERAELRRRLSSEWNGMRLHELYFDNLGGPGPPSDREPVELILRDRFGTVAAWQRDLADVARNAGAGWAVLYYDPRARRLINGWIGHDGGGLAGCVPMVVLDLFEHAYLHDYGLNRSQYVDRFFANLRWKEIARRFEEVAFVELRSADRSVRPSAAAVPTGEPEVELELSPIPPAEPGGRAGVSPRLRPH